ncbi:MAG: indole-3-glycerol phosphate synthase TrpC [Bryobacterales bacterium]|nr:indole-3-glycerol phosphate synthase TrpC [Bryobacterales bacterium]
MTTAVPGVLSRIVDQKRAELSHRKHLRDRFEATAGIRVQGRRPFRQSLESRPRAVIAEIKKASPSKGVLVHDFNPPLIARMYEDGGSSALSVLTDERFFQGSLADLEAARAAVALPALRKDFTIDDFHVVEAAAHGADAILLIVAILTVAELIRFRELAERYRMDVLVEVHDAGELTRALDSGARIVGVNNRNLHDFTVTLNTSLDLAPRIPSSVLKISESGIHSAADVDTLSSAGYQAFLVGEHLMKAPDPTAALKALWQR